MFRPLVTAAAVLALLGGCSKQEAQAPAAATTPAPAAQAAAPAAMPAPAAPDAAQPAVAAAPAPAAAPAAPVQQAAAAAAGQSIDIFGGSSAPVPASHNRGKVTEILNGGGYTYAEVQMASGKKVWVAGSAIEAKPGTEVEWGNYGLMRDFQSKSLNRTFGEILFVDRWNVVGKAPVAVAPHGTFPNGQPAVTADQMAAAAAGASPAAADPSARGTVKNVQVAGGYSYIEVDQGGGKTVWVAAMETPMKAGDKVQWQGGTQMSNFTAKSLNKTFERIIFAQTVSVGK